MARSSCVVVKTRTLEASAPTERPCGAELPGDTGTAACDVKHLLDISSRPGGNLSTCRRSSTPSRRAPPAGAGSPPAPRVLPGRHRPQGRRRAVRGLPLRGQGPPQVHPRRRGADARAGPRRGVVAVMASAINFNTVWTSIFEPLPTFGFLDRLGKESVWGKRHDLPYHIVGSDASGVVLRTGSAVRNWKPGDRVTIHCNYVDDQDPTAHDDSMLAANQRIWGFETNFGGLADLTVVKANQLMPKPAHLTWEEAACNALTNSTCYRMLVSPNGAAVHAGRHRPHLGRHRRPRRLRRASTSSTAAASRWRRSARPRRSSCCTSWACEARHRPQGRGLPLLEGRAHPGPGGVAPPRQAHPRAGRRGPRHRLRAPRPPDHGRLGLRGPAGRHDRHLRGHLGLHDRVRQPVPLDEAQDHQGLATSPTTGRPGRPTG